MTFVEKIENSFGSLIKSDLNETYFVSNDWISYIWKNDPDKELIIETVNKILDLINKSNIKNKQKLIDTEISELIEMVKS